MSSNRPNPRKASVGQEEGRQFEKTLVEFREKAEQMLNQTISNFNELLRQSVTNFNTMQAHFAKGNQDIVEQTNKTNREMIEVTRSNYQRLRDQFIDNYKHFKETTNASFQNNVRNYNENMGAILKKYPYLPPSASEDMLNKLRAKFEGNMKHFDDKYNEMVREMGKSSEDFIEAVTLTVAYGPSPSEQENPQEGGSSQDLVKYEYGRGGGVRNGEEQKKGWDLNVGSSQTPSTSPKRTGSGTRAPGTSFGSPPPRTGSPSRGPQSLSTSRGSGGSSFGINKPKPQDQKSHLNF